MKKALSVLCLFCLISCVSTKPQTPTYSLEGIWEPVGVEINGEFAAIFEDNTFEILADNEPILKTLEVGNVRYSIKNSKLIIDSSTGERFVADIEFSGPNDVKIFNFTATQKAAIIAMSIRGAALKIPPGFDNSLEWMKNTIIHLRKIS